MNEQFDKRLERVIGNLRGDPEYFCRVLTDTPALLAKVIDYCEHEAERKRCEPWSIAGQIFGHGSGVSAAIVELYRRDEKGGGE